MANGDEQDLIPPKVEEIAEGVAAEFFSVQNLTRFWSGASDPLTKVVSTFVGMILGLSVRAAAYFANIILEGETIADPAFQRLGQTAIKDITGIDVGPIGGPGDRDRREAGARNIGAAVLNALTGNAGGGGGGRGELQPSLTAAEDLATFIVQMRLEGYITGVIGEVCSLGLIESLGDLDDALSQSLGLGRLSRIGLGPIVRTAVGVPAEWRVNKTFRPSLLSTGEAIRQFLRGNWTREQLDEELARQGYSADRIDALVNGQKKFFGAGEVRAFVDRKHWPMDKGIQHLRDQGYDQDGAVDALRLEGLRRIEQLEASEGSVILAAYADRRIAAGEMRSMLNAAVKNDEERALLEELAEVRRATNIRHLSPAEARACVKVGILAFRDYERALERDGYTPEAVDALDLLLRVEITKDRDLAELRAEQADERAAAKVARETAAAERRAQVEADRARRRRGPIADLERAVIRGLIPFERLAEVLAADYDPDTVGILLALVEDDRQRYLEQQARADEARQRGNRRAIDVGGLERAVMAGLLTPEEFAQRLEFLNFEPADAALLTAVVRAKKADQDAAVRARREAEERARRQRIDLSRFERLVRRGARSLAEYDAMLAGLGFEDADRAAMRELLELQIADDRRADAERAAAEARLEPRGLSLEQFRRAVVLGTRSEDDYQRFLVAENFTADAQEVLLTDLRIAVAEADDARRRREQDAPLPGSRGLPLGTLQRAARLGIITPDTYLARLQALGYSDDDLSIELELLLLEIADTQAARATRTAAEPEAEARGLSLAQVERAVRAGALTLEDYRTAAIAAGMARDAVDVVVAVLAQEVGSLTEAREIRAIVLRRLADQNVSLEELETRVTKGGQPFDVFIGELQQRGVGADEAELVASLLVDELEAAAAKSGGSNG